MSTCVCDHFNMFSGAGVFPGVYRSLCKCVYRYVCMYVSPGVWLQVYASVFLVLFIMFFFRCLNLCYLATCSSSHRYLQVCSQVSTGVERVHVFRCRCICKCISRCVYLRCRASCSSSCTQVSSRRRGRIWRVSCWVSLEPPETWHWSAGGTSPVEEQPMTCLHPPESDAPEESK